VQYCSSVSMKRVGSLRAIAIIALLLPGLVTAAPIAGSCGLCGQGDACHMKRAVEQVSESHSCCGEAPAEAPPEPSLGSSACECGREAPPAVTVVSSTTIDAASSPAVTEATISPAPQVGSAFANSSRPPAPPPAPPAYLIDCAFLT
jgi:hypothetical protein